jgi:NhaA family Na+:H+ antiporter
MAKGIYIAPWEKSFDRLLTPMEQFIHRQTTSGVLLMVCALAAIVIANSPLQAGYEAFLHKPVSIGFSEAEFSLSIHHWINELLMAFFFFVIGLELKRELLVGELSSPKQALLPIVAAAGGMVIPALCYLAFNPSGLAASGWGVPMATDIAFAIGILSLLGNRVPRSLVTFLIALAIVDDLGAVLVIALFYTGDLNMQALGYAALCTGILVTFQLGGIRHGLPYAMVGMLLWAAMLASGIHATIAGVIVAFTIPIRPKFDPALFLDKVRDLTGKMERSIADHPDIIHNTQFRGYVHALGEGVHLVQAPAQRAEDGFHLPVAYLVIPVFALANAGIPIDFEDYGAYLVEPITLGILAGLLIGKPLGIAGFTWIALKLGMANLPEEISMRDILAVGLLGGIGFTMSIFIADLGFVDYPRELLLAKCGIITASLVAGVAGFLLLFLKDRVESDG